MSLDSPVASESDSLGDKEPMENLPETGGFVRGHVNYTTFTRPRPTNLHRNPSRGQRLSLLSPHSVDNLETDGAETPDFAMTQSMYEPYGKKEQIEKLTQQNKLMSLMASERAAYKAQKKKQKEMKQKAIEQKRKNEDRQKIVEERRIKMLAEEEEKRKRLINKTTKCSNITSSCYGNMTQSIITKTKSSSSSKFLASRPLSSTGKIFGFGSSAPRYICDPIKTERPTHNNPSYLDMSKEYLPLSRMCTSQIVSRTTQPDHRDKHTKNFSSNISKSTANISDANQQRNRNGKGSTVTVSKATRTTPKNIKMLNSVSKFEVVNRKTSDHISNVNSHSRSRSKDVITPTKPRSTTIDRNILSPSNLSLPRQFTTNSKTPMTVPKEADSRTNSKGERARSVGNRTRVSDNRAISVQQTSEGKCEPTTGRISEVRFVNAAQSSDTIDKDNENTGPENRKIAPKQLTNEEYKERMILKRKLAKEKKIKEEIEREIEKERQLSDNVAEVLTPVDTSITTESEISINILPKDRESAPKTNVEVPVEVPLTFDAEIVRREDNSERDVLSSGDEIPRISEHSNSSLVKIKETVVNIEEEKVSISDSIIPSIEVPECKIELTASTEALDRLERKKRLDSIMSRIKKTPTGSSENVNYHMSTSTLQTMMDKGHLSGMSKTAAVLMKNAHRSSELLSSSSDLLSASDYKPPSISRENLADINITRVDDVSVSRGDCDGKEDSPKTILPNMETKSNLMQNLSANAEGSYFTSWKEKYSVSDSLDSENDNSEGIYSYK